MENKLGIILAIVVTVALFVTVFVGGLSPTITDKGEQIEEQINSSSVTDSTG